MTELGKYLQKKLVTCYKRIEVLKASIISQVGDGKFGNLKSLYDDMMTEEAKRKELTKDLVENVTVTEVIEINLNKDYFGNPQYPLFKEYDLVYAYKYRDKAISLSDRDLLVKTYGYIFKEIKV